MKPGPLASAWRRFGRAVAIFNAATLLLAGQAMAIDADKVPAAKRSASGLHLTAVEAAEMKQGAPGKVLFIDIRTRAEAMYVGMATSVDYLVPFLEFPEVWEWSDASNEFVQLSNTHFVQDVESRLARVGLSKDDAVVLICRSGIRSNHAAGLLAQYGFKRAYTVIDGFEGDTAKDGERKGQRVVNGWKNANQPWSYKLLKDKMYLDDL
ncbi:rhodanese-like domain-containing protein [Hydrogenophaga sp.]|jgi:rhodanese-related sulfurtransferase|uniref:rhodanese-like domain-containing protein n=1 Tax=Hydrogenophaga sp. TaxID=1904254 RepID=UPI002735CD84|nr:rhodanese-like domain-containing protein [Hydrogenophaga sp.]MDP3885357.1 rhodanese-like domain-containing protein [Hydrogenophaga sp.]